MYEPLAVTSAEDRARFCSLPGLSVLTPEVLARHRPDAHWILTNAGGVVARCSLWWQETPALAEHRLGLIGHYAAVDGEAAARILDWACMELEHHGCTLAVGPIDGNTWQRYRLLSERGDEPVFFLEPDNPDSWPAHFTGNRFTALAHYYSAINTDLERTHPRLTEIAQRVAERGITLRPLRLERFEDELRLIYAVSIASFASNFLYTPIGEEECLAQYRPIAPHVRPELVLIAERDRQPVGYSFAVPDLNQARRGQAIDTAVLKTLAVHPDLGGLGLGTLLMARCHEAALALGFTRVIHALMHEDNASRRLSSYTARTIRRYVLYSRPLGLVR